MPASTPVLGLGHQRRAFLLVPLFLFLFSTYVRAQDVAEAARQQRAQKAEQKQVAPHVYTDEDLKREKILTPEDQARADARKQTHPANGQENAETLPAGPTEPTESLGDIARRYRNEKEAREAAEAAKKNLGPFPYAVPETTLASPNPAIAPDAKSIPDVSPARRPEIFRSLAPHVHNNPNASRGRISPFQPRPQVAAPLAPPVLTAPANPRLRPPLAYGSSQPLARPEHVATMNPTPVMDSGALRAVKVQRGDSWWKLAERYLNSGARWPELRSLNPVVNQPAESLRAGSTIVVPELSGEPVAPSHMRIVVKKGDTLWALAREHLGHASSWGCLAHANPQVLDFTRLQVGSKLRLPDSAALETCLKSQTDSAE